MKTYYDNKLTGLEATLVQLTFVAENIDEIIVKSVNIVNITLKTIGEQRDQVYSQRVPSLWRVCLFVCPKLLFQTIILVTIGEQCNQVHS